MREERGAETVLRGADALRSLAGIYQQLYLDPAQPESREVYRAIVRRGQDAVSRSLDHFRTDADDILETVATPAGEVTVLTLCVRQDFETFLRIMAERCEMSVIPASQGASMLNGVINWQKIRSHKAEWLREESDRGITDPDWSAEFKRFTADGKNYKDALIVLSTGPYSNLEASELGLDETEWIGRSQLIRKNHELTHFFCRRKYPEQVHAVWDEVVADAAGILAAFGRFDRRMEERFLGIGENGYMGGRLENYLGEGEDPNRLALRIREWLLRIGELYENEQPSDMFDFVTLLEERQQQFMNDGGETGS